MLSERQLARGYPALWRRWMPGLDAGFIREAAAPEGRLHRHVHHWAPALVEETLAARSDLLAEVAFGLFAAAARGGMRIDRISAAEERRITRAAGQRMEILRHRGLSPIDSPAQVKPLSLDAACARRVRTLAQRLYEHLAASGQPLRVQPRVSGAGLLQACHPDVLRGEELIEVKMSRASFRSSDIRQAVVYAALLHAEGVHTVRSLRLVNPRLGVTWNFMLDDLAHETAGCSAAAMLERIVEWAVAFGQAQGDDR